MTHDTARYEIVVEGDSYSIAEWESIIKEAGDPDLTITVESCEVNE